MMRNETAIPAALVELAATGNRRKFLEDFLRTLRRNSPHLSDPPGDPGKQGPKGRNANAGGRKQARQPNSNRIERMKTMRQQDANTRTGADAGGQKAQTVHARGNNAMNATKTKTIHTGSRRAAGITGILALAGGLFAASPALADITNTATVNGLFGGNPVTATSSTINVPVATPDHNLDIAKSVFAVATQAAGTNASATDGGDTIVYRYTVTNSGNVTETNVVINDAGPTFDGVAGTGSFTSGPSEVAGGSGTAASLAPGQTVIFEATYTLSDADAYRGAGAADPANSVVNNATADSDSFTMLVAEQATATTGIVPVASLSLVKNFSFSVDGGTAAAADVGDVIAYTYTVANTGNVPVSTIYISDAHETGDPHASTFDSSAFAGPLGTGVGDWDIAVTTPATFGANVDDGADGTYETIGVGSTVQFTYYHEVTQAEFDAQ